MRWGHKFPTWMRSLLPRRSLGQLDGIWPTTGSFGSTPIDLWGSLRPSLEKSFVLHFQSCSFQLSKSPVVWLQSSSLQQLVHGSKANQSIHHWLPVELQLQSWFHQTSLKTRFPLSQPPYKSLEMQTHSKHPDDTNGCSDQDVQSFQVPCHHHLHHLSNQRPWFHLPLSSLLLVLLQLLLEHSHVVMELVQLACHLRPLLQSEVHLPKIPLDPQKVVQHLDHWVLLRSIRARPSWHRTALLHVL